MKITQILGYEHFFEMPKNIGAKKLALANKIGRTKLKLFCFLLLSKYRKNTNWDVEDYLKEIFTTDNFSYIRSPSYSFIKCKYVKLRKIEPELKFELIAIESLLNMYLWIIENEKNILEIEEIKPFEIISLLELHLLFNSDLLINISEAENFAHNENDIKHFYKYFLTISFSSNDLTNFNYNWFLITQLYKASQLLIFLRENNKHKELLSNFLKKFNLISIGNYIQTMLTGAKLIINDSENGNYLDTKDATERGRLNQFLNEYLCSDFYNNSDQDDFLRLRSSPLEKKSENEYYVIFDLFFIKKIYNGLIFSLSKVDGDIKGLYGKKPTFLGEIRKDFSEGVLLYKVMNKVLKDEVFEKINGDEIKGLDGNKLKREPDYLAINKDAILLFESKDFYMRGKEKLSYNFDTIVKGLRTDKAGKIDRLGKAIVQLKENIERVYLKQFKLCTNYEESTIKIYPIVIVHDALYSCLALNYWVNSWLKDEIIKLKSDKKLAAYNFENIKPLTIVEIDTLIVYRENFIEGDISLVDLIEKFHHFVNNKSENNDVLQSSTPFAKFVNDYIADNGINPKVGKVLKELMLIN